MISEVQVNKIKWIDLESPTKEELHDIMQQYNIDPVTMQELLEPSLKPRVEKIGDYLYLVLHFPSTRDGKMLSEQEIDFVLGDDFLITAHYQAIPVFEELRKLLKAKKHKIDSDLFESIDDDGVYSSTIELFLDIVHRMYHMVEMQIDDVREDLEEIEAEIFNEKEKEMVFALSYAGRDVLNLRQALDPHDEILKSLLGYIDTKDHSIKMRARLVENDYYRLKERTEQLWHSLSELRETNNSLLTTKQNEVMKIFTILAFVTFPLSLVSSLFGMNTQYIPITGMHIDLGFMVIKDFWVVIALMTFATILMFVYFKHKKWI